MGKILKIKTIKCKEKRKNKVLIKLHKENNKLKINKNQKMMILIMKKRIVINFKIMRKIKTIRKHKNDRYITNKYSCIYYILIVTNFVV